MNACVFICAGVCSHLDLAEVDRSTDQLVVLRELFTRRKLDEDFAQLSAITAARPRRGFRVHGETFEYVCLGYLRSWRITFMLAA